MKWFKGVLAGALLNGLITFPAFSQSFSIDSSDFAASLAQADALFVQKQYQAAYDELTALPAASSPSDVIHIGVKRSELLAKFLPKKDFDLSLQIVQDLIGKYPADPAIYLAQWRLAREYAYDLPVARRDAARAQDLLMEVIQNNPDVPEAPQIRLDYVNTLYNQGKIETALEGYRQLLEEAKNKDVKVYAQPFLAYMLGDCYSRLGRRSEAVDAWNYLTQAYPNSNWAGNAQWRLPQSTPPEPAQPVK